jgi:hypothetical protein
MAGSTQVIYRAGKHSLVHNVRLVAENVSSVLAPHASCQVTTKHHYNQLQFCMHTLDVHSLTRQVSQSTETDHTLPGAGML